MVDFSDKQRAMLAKRGLAMPDGGYPIVVSYRSSCPKYRHLCPLPREDANRLRAIEIDGEVPVACERYASLSNIR